MTPVKSIVVGTDFSDHASLAVERAAQLAGQHDARLLLVAAAPMPVPMPVWGDMASGAWIDQSDAVRWTETNLHALRDILAQRFGIEPLVHCESAPAVALVLDQAEAAKADLLVIGATGEGALARRLFGSTAQSIVRRAKRPVLVVRHKVEAPYARLLVATDFSDDAAAAARLARALAPEATLSLFTALEQPRLRVDLLGGLGEAARDENLHRARDTARAHLGEFGAALGASDAPLYVRDGRASHELDQVLAETDAELLSVGAHGKSRLEAGMLGSTSLHAVHEAPCDVLVTPHHPS